MGSLGLISNSDSAEWSKQLMYRRAKVGGRGRVLIQRRAQDLPGLLFHRATVFRRPYPKAPLEALFQVAHRDAGHAVTPPPYLRYFVTHALPIVDCNSYTIRDCGDSPLEHRYAVDTGPSR